MTQFISTSLLLWIKSGSSSTLDHYWIIIETRSSLDHHQSWIITGSPLKLDHHWIIIKSGSSLDHHQSWIITAFTISINWCYLSILLIIGSSTKPTLFHVGCRPSLHVGHHLLQHLYMIQSERLAQHLYLTMGGTYPRTMPERPSQHLHLTMGGTHPPPCQKGSSLTSDHGRNKSTTMSESLNTYIHQHGRTHLLPSVKRLQHLHPLAW